MRAEERRRGASGKEAAVSSMQAVNHASKNKGTAFKESFPQKPNICWTTKWGMKLKNKTASFSERPASLWAERSGDLPNPSEEDGVQWLLSHDSRSLQEVLRVCNDEGVLQRSVSVREAAVRSMQTVSPASRNPRLVHLPSPLLARTVSSGAEAAQDHTRHPTLLSI